MGANGSRDKRTHFVLKKKRTHIDSRYRIDGHKVVIQSKNTKQACNILHSNSANPIYIIGVRNKEGFVEIHSVNIFKNHNLEIEINLKYDNNGNLMPYNGAERNSHCHYWEERKDGRMHRKDTDNKHEAIPAKFSSLLANIVKFNKEQHKFKRHGKV